MSAVLEKRLVLVGGKGGVGKTTVAAALGMLSAQRDRRTLVVSTDPAHSLGDAFGRELGDRPRCLLPQLDALEIDPDAEVDAHLKGVMDQLRRYAALDMLPELERQLRLSRQAPGTQEAALLERVSRLMTDDGLPYDRIIFDTAPTGHTLRLLTLPEAIAAWTEGLLKHNRKSEELGQVLKHLTPGSGRDLQTPFDDPETDRRNQSNERTAGIAERLLERRRLFHRARRLLTDPASSAFIFVMAPERLSVLETCRAVRALEAVDIPVACAIVNRILPDVAGGAFLAARRAQEEQYLAEIDQQLAHLPRQRLPLLARDINGIEGLEIIVEHLKNAGF